MTAKAQKPQRILILSGCKIFPNVTGGNLRTGGVAKSLARMGHEVCIYSIAGRKPDYNHGQGMLLQAIEENLVEEVNLALWTGLIQTVARRLGLPRFWQYLLLLFGIIPASLRNRLNWADIIIADLPITPPIPGPWRKKTWLLLSHNLEHRLMAQGSRIERICALWMERIEMVATLRYDGILACAKEDLDYFRARARNPEAVRLVQNGVDPDLYIHSKEEGLGLRRSWGLTDDDWLVVFSGSRFQPNLDALAKLEAFLAKEHDFLVRNRIKILLLGSIRSTPSITDTMIVTGPVPETYPYFAAADAALNPVETGSGSNVKIFEYLAARLPVIATRFGIRGTLLDPTVDVIEFKDGHQIESFKALVEGRTKAAWKDHAEAVWSRVQDSCDMTEILKREWKGLPLEKAPDLKSLKPLVTGTSNR